MDPLFAIMVWGISALLFIGLVVYPFIRAWRNDHRGWAWAILFLTPILIGPTLAIIAYGLDKDKKWPFEKGYKSLADASKPAPTNQPVDNTYKLPPDPPRDRTVRLPPEVPVETKAQPEQRAPPPAVESETPTPGVAFERVDLAYPFKKVKIPIWRTFVFAAIGSIIGVVLLWLAVEVGRKLDKMFLLIAWFIPGIVAQEMVKKYAKVPNIGVYPLATLVMFVTISVIGVLGSFPLMEKYDMNTWFVIVVLLLSAGLSSVRSKNEVHLYPTCEKCDQSLQLHTVWGYKIADAEAILAHLNEGELQGISELGLSSTPKDVAKLHIHYCPNCHDGMVSLILTGEHSGRTYRRVPVYSKRESKTRLDEMIQTLKKARGPRDVPRPS